MDVSLEGFFLFHIGNIAVELFSANHSQIALNVLYYVHLNSNSYS